LSRAQTNVSAQVQKLLPSGKCAVDVMEISFPLRFRELAEKMQVAISTNKEWWLGYVKQNADSGKPLPYNSGLGMTKEEWDEYLYLGEKRTLEKVRTCTLKVTTHSEIYELDGGSDLPSLTGLKVNLKELTIATPYGNLKNPTLDESPGGPALGAFSGYRWYLEKGDIDKGNITVVSFLVGKLRDSGRNFIYYKGGESRSNQPISNVSIVFYFDKT